jgi:hypothetical protein
MTKGALAALARVQVPHSCQMHSPLQHPHALTKRCLDGGDKSKQTTMLRKNVSVNVTALRRPNIRNVSRTSKPSVKVVWDRVILSAILTIAHGSAQIVVFENC